MNRQQRRAAVAKGKGLELQRALQQAEVAVRTLNQSNLEQLPVVIAQLKEQTARAARLADALADDYETLCLEQAVLKELFHEILGPSYLESLAAAKDRVLQAQASQSKESPG